MVEKVDRCFDELLSEMEVRTGRKSSWRSLKFCGITRKKVTYDNRQSNEDKAAVERMNTI